MDLSRETWLALTGLAACGLALLVAYGAEHLLGLVPCAFCLLERKPYVAGIDLSLLALLLPRRFARMALWALVAVLAAGAALSLVHAGVEFHLWPDPLAQCSVPRFSGMTMAERLAAMPARPQKPCEDPDYLIPFLPISITDMGFLYALVISSFLAMSLSRSKGIFFK
jgi:disulfide bond formation protein DsbB